jgi:hypothetical protein
MPKSPLSDSMEVQFKSPQRKMNVSDDTNLFQKNDRDREQKFGLFGLQGACPFWDRVFDT